MDEKTKEELECLRARIFNITKTIKDMGEELTGCLIRMDRIMEEAKLIEDSSKNN